MNSVTRGNLAAVFCVSILFVSVMSFFCPASEPDTPAPARQYLLIRSTQEENVYGRYVSELLKSEGLNGFEILDIDTAAMPEFTQNDIIIVTRCFLKFGEMDQLVNAVKQGATLICILPESDLVSRLGWIPDKTSLYPGSIRIRHGFPGCGSPIQTHVPVANCSPPQGATGYEIAADAVNSDWNANGFPAVAKQKIEKGTVVFFFYDIGQAVARIRFGNPDLASHMTAHILYKPGWLWPSELFQGYADPRILHLPQADFHCQLLAKMITDASPYPLARLWYYEKIDHRCAALFTCDDDDSNPQQFQELADSLASHSAKATFFLMKRTQLSDGRVRQLVDAGHTIGPHINFFDTTEEMYFAFPELVAEETKFFDTRYGSRSTSVQAHWNPWQGYMSWVKLFRDNNYRMLLSYISYRPMMERFMCGSARPMKFVNLDGTIYDCWQQPIMIMDDYDPPYIEKMKNADGMINEFKGILIDSIERHHSPVTFDSHPLAFSMYSKPYFNGCLDVLQEKGVPVYNADQWCDFADARQSVKISQQLTANSVRYKIENLSCRLPLMLPLKAGAASCVTIDSKKADCPIYKRLEQDYIFIDLAPKQAPLYIETGY